MPAAIRQFSSARTAGARGRDGWMVCSLPRVGQLLWSECNMMNRARDLSQILLLIIGVATPSIGTAGQNQGINLALDLRTKTKTRSCLTMADMYTSCSAINPSISLPEGVSNLDVVPIVFNFTGITALEF